MVAWCVVWTLRRYVGVRRTWPSIAVVIDLSQVRGARASVSDVRYSVGSGVVAGSNVHTYTEHITS